VVLGLGSGIPCFGFRVLGLEFGCFVLSCGGFEFWVFGFLGFLFGGLIFDFGL
jgi:hypothetical protein